MQLDSEEFLNLPALAPPPCVIPNFQDPPSLRAPGVAVLQLILVTLAVWMRLYTKHIVVRNMFVEDWWLLASWLAFAGFHVLIFQLENLPFGIHQWNVTTAFAILNAKLFHLSSAIYAVVALTLKVAIILQIRRIVLPRISTSSTKSTRSRLLRLTIDFFLFLNVAFYLALFFFQFLTCRPLHKVWDFRVPGTCGPHHLIVHIISASINTLSDLITVLLPQPVIWSLNLDRRRRFGLSIVFMIGLLACTASAFRLYFAIKLYYATDVTFVAGQMGKWVEPELMFGFLAACLPVLPAFVKHVRRVVRRVRGQTVTTYPSYSSNNGGKRGYAEGCGSRGVGVVGSVSGSAKRGDVTKCVDTDIEFERLTRERSHEALVRCEWDRRSSEDERRIEVKVPEASFQRWN
ncbi:hypothetical protein EK21DRAFT_117021 [Setomelanomma holmii]|uniref:Rhodopsin domain-containing protein n=1 Tax=Setomelanomma holmii TaxID=210430 RepID=A0A9P4LHA3_9PLEO|nr:hypothetical protein EK21DRAFT_117021 [Setomelanomma holmii]